MAREVITRVWCDVCLEQDDARVEGAETPAITIGQLKPRVLALCQVHTKEVFEPIRELLTELGSIVDADTSLARFPGTSPGSGTFPCPDPKCHKHAKPFKHQQSLRNHTREVHDMPIREMQRVFAQGNGQDELPMGEPEEEPPPTITEAACDVPGCSTVYKWPRHRRPAQALGVHKAMAHKIKGTRGK